MKPSLGSFHHERVTVLTENQISVRSIIGNGAFGVVHAVEVSDVDTRSHPRDATCDDLEHSTRSFTKRKQRYAMKRLQRELISCGRACLDFAREIDILARLPQHENVVHVYGVSSNYLSGPEDAFVVMERLVDTLQERLVRWHMRERNQQRISRKNKVLRFVGKWPGGIEAQNYRIQEAALGIAAGLHHIHMHGLIYRDLKPANVGFAADGTVRLFDFGMARPVLPTNKDNGEYRLTGACGSARYMSPENALHQEYNQSSDVYSFGILLWQICCLQVPFQGVSLQNWFHAVVRGKRPNIRYIASPAIRSIMQLCWDGDSQIRPSFAVIPQWLLESQNSIKRMYRPNRNHRFCKMKYNSERR